MIDLVEAYIEFLQNFTELERPLIPKFDVTAYTESEYVSAVEDILKDCEYIDDLSITEHFLKGD